MNSLPFWKRVVAPTHRGRRPRMVCYGVWGSQETSPSRPPPRVQKPPSRLYLSPTSISHHHIHNRLTSKHPPLLFFSIIYVSTILAKMCGGAIIADLIPRNRTRRVSPSDLWPDSPFFSTPTPQMKPFPSSSGNHRNICVFPLFMYATEYGKWEGDLDVEIQPMLY